MSDGTSGIEGPNVSATSVKLAANGVVLLHNVRTIGVRQLVRRLSHTAVHEPYACSKASPYQGRRLTLKMRDSLSDRWINH